MTGTGRPSLGGGTRHTVVRVTVKDEVRDFLTTRRARVTPREAGLTVFGANRRVPGLRREEVAMLAGVSADYYIRLERGNLAGVSEQVLDALARALRLDDAERAHLFDLARASAGPVRGSRRAAVSSVNLARLLFLDDRAPAFFLDWETVADDAAAALRAEAGRNPHDKSLTSLVGELATRSDEFRTRWARHNVKHHRRATKRLHCSLVGELTVDGEALELTGDGLVIITYTAEPDSPSAAALRFLSSWATEHRNLSGQRAAEMSVWE